MVGQILVSFTGQVISRRTQLWTMNGTQRTTHGGHRAITIVELRWAKKGNINTLNANHSCSRQHSEIYFLPFATILYGTWRVNLRFGQGNNCSNNLWKCLLFLPCCDNLNEYTRHDLMEKYQKCSFYYSLNLVVWLLPRLQCIYMVCPRKVLLVFARKKTSNSILEKTVIPTPLIFSFSTSVTLKIRSWSPKSIQFFVMSQL